MTEYKTLGEPLWNGDHDNEPEWSKPSNFNDPANPLNKPTHYDPFTEHDPNVNLAYLPRRKPELGGAPRFGTLGKVK
jgi:hypothetical protein